MNLFVLIWFVLTFVLFYEQDFIVPVHDAEAKDWNQASFWSEPWGDSGVHKGIDIFARKGTDTVSAVSGLVIYADALKLGGNVVMIIGPQWHLHYYAHLDTINTRIGQWVNRGQKVGEVGTTGNAVGKPPHLHYSIFSIIPNLNQYFDHGQDWQRMFYLNPDDYLRKDMSTNRSKKTTAEILQERYTRIMGSDWTPSISGGKKTNKNWVQWLAWPLILLVLGFLIWFFFKNSTKHTEKLETPSTQPDLQQRQEVLPIPGLPLKSEFDSGQLADDRDIQAEAAARTPFKNRLHSVGSQGSSLDEGTKTEVLETDNFLVIAKSTTSKEEAIAYAIKLRESGYKSEVILSSTGFYGIALGRFNYADAKKSMADAKVSGIVSSKPYLMEPDRVTDFVDIEQQMPFD